MPKPKPAVVEEAPKEEQKESSPKGENEFWKMTGFKGPKPGQAQVEEPAEDEIILPLYEVPYPSVLKSMVFHGTMKRVRMSKEKSEYKQIVYPSDQEGIKLQHFNSYLPKKLMVFDKKVKELQEVKVRFKLLNAWKDAWPQCKIIEIIKK